MAEKVYISEGIITEAMDCARDDEVKQYGIPSVDIKIEVSEICDNKINGNVKKEDEVFCANDVKIEFDSGLLFCNRCREISQDFCTKCETLAHVLNPNTLGITYKGESEEIPKNILEIKELFGRLGIFTLRVIPKGVKFGPFTGLGTSGSGWKLKHGRFVVDEDESKFLNWMRHINPARSMSVQNLLAFQCDSNLYYRSTRKIQVDEELLVYFGEEYDESLNDGTEVDFIPTVEEDSGDVFACTFCCLGFTSKSYLNEHKIICSSKIDEKFSIEELMQCPFCKVHMWKKEYFEYHVSYCCETSDRTCVIVKPDKQTFEVHGSGTQRRHTYKCARCKYKTAYKGDLNNHIYKHYEVKIYKCGICNRRFKMRKYLKTHMENTHGALEGEMGQKWLKRECKETHTKTSFAKVHPGSQEEVKQFGSSDFQTKCKYFLQIHGKGENQNAFRYKCEMCDYKTNKKSHIVRHIKARHTKEFDYECEMCDYKANQKKSLENHVKSKHFNDYKYTCEMCEFKTNGEWYLRKHIQSKHLKEFSYECGMCKYKTNKKSSWEVHIKSKHLKEFSYKCEMCEFKTNGKSYLRKHIQSIHLKEFDHQCEMCEFKTNEKSRLTVHIKSKHLKEFKYKCEMCEYETNKKWKLENHIKTKHLKKFDYQCAMCKYETNNKTRLQVHIKTVHLKECEYKCGMCKYETSNKTHLENHIKSKHLKEFDYECEMCKYKTNRKVYLENHIKSKHLKEFKYECEMCEFKTNQNSLETHIKTKHLKEYNYECEICEYKTNEKSHLERHVKTKHLKEFDYECEMCEYKTNRKTDIDNHIKSKHLKEYKYKCEMCDVKTNKKSYLTMHTKTKHLK